MAGKTVQKQKPNYQHCIVTISSMKQNHIYARDIKETMSHIDFFFSRVWSVEEGVQRGLHDARGELFIAVIGRGCFAFDTSNRIPSEGYIGEKLQLHPAEAREIIKVIKKNNN